MPSAALIQNPYEASGLASGIIVDPNRISTRALIGDGWNDAENLSDGNLWSSWSPSFAATHQVRLGFGGEVSLSTVSVLVQPGNFLGGSLDLAIAAETYRIDLERTGWITLTLDSPILASSVDLTRDGYDENITEIVFGVATPVDPPEPPDPPSHRLRTVEQSLGTNWFPAPVSRDYAGIVRDLRPGEELLDDNGNFSPSRAGRFAWGYDGFNDPSNPLAFFPMISGGPRDEQGYPENRLSDYDIPANFTFADTAPDPLPQVAFEQASAYEYHAELIKDTVAFFNNPNTGRTVTVNGSTLNTGFDYLEHWNEPNRLFLSGKNDDDGWLTPGEYAAMASADYDALQSLVDTPEDAVKQVMGGLVFEWEASENWDSPLHRWQSQPGDTLPSWQDRPETYDPLAWLNAVRDWSEVNRGAGELPVDVINLHLYAVDETQGSVRPGISPEDYGVEKALDAYDTWRDNYNATHDRNLEFWMTEFGYSVEPPARTDFWQAHVETEAQQSKWTVRTFLAGLAQDVDVMTQYVYQDLRDPEQPDAPKFWDQYTGAIDEFAQPRPVAYAVERFRDELAGMRFAGKVVYNGRDGVNVYAFENATGQGAYVVWSGNEQTRDLSLDFEGAELTRLVELEGLDATTVDQSGSVGDRVTYTTVSDDAGDQLLLQNVNGHPVILQVDALPAVDYIDPEVQAPTFLSGPSQTYDLTTAAGGWNYWGSGVAQIDSFNPGRGDRVDLPDGVTSGQYTLHEETYFGGSLNGDADTTDAVLAVWNSGIGGFDAIAVFDNWRAWTPPRSLGAVLPDVSI